MLGNNVWKGNRERILLHIFGLFQVASLLLFARSNNSASTSQRLSGANESRIFGLGDR
jgi:hypothetical protein